MQTTKGKSPESTQQRFPIPDKGRDYTRNLASLGNRIVREENLNRGRIISVGRALDCREGGRGFDSWDRTNTHGNEWEMNGK